MTEPRLKNLSIRGSFKGAGGYDHHVREFVRALVDLGVGIELQDFDQWSPQKLSESAQERWYETLGRSVDSKILLHFTMPHQVVVDTQKLNVNYTMFEATRIPKDWIAHNLKHDLVIMPTISSQEAWIESGYPEDRTRLCPLGINGALFHDGVSALPLEAGRGRQVRDYTTRFLNISEVIPRKNLVGLIQTWIQTTTVKDDTILILKLSCPWKRWLYKFFFDVKCMERRIGKTRKQAASILFLINERWPDAEMPRLYKTATHYISLSHGEGWDLCMMEAAASGLSLIAPAHSAYTTYLDESLADMISAKRIPAKFRWAHGLHKLFKGAEWWQVDEEQTCAFVRNAIDGKGRDKNEKLSSRILEEYAWKKSANRMVEVLSALGA